MWLRSCSNGGLPNAAAPKQTGLSGQARWTCFLLWGPPLGKFPTWKIRHEYGHYGSHSSRKESMAGAELCKPYVLFSNLPFK